MKYGIIFAVVLTLAAVGLFLYQPEASTEEKEKHFLATADRA